MRKLSNMFEIEGEKTYKYIITLQWLVKIGIQTRHSFFPNIYEMPPYNGAHELYSD